MHDLSWLFLYLFSNRKHKDLTPCGQLLQRIKARTQATQRSSCPGPGEEWGLGTLCRHPDVFPRVPKGARVLEEGSVGHCHSQPPSSWASGVFANLPPGGGPGTHLGHSQGSQNLFAQRQVGVLTFSQALYCLVSGAHKGLQTALTAPPTPSIPVQGAMEDEVGTEPSFPPMHVQSPCSFQTTVTWKANCQYLQTPGPQAWNPMK